MWVARSGELNHDFWYPNNQLKNREMRDYATARAIGFAAILVLAELLENPLAVYPRNKTK